MTTEAIAQTIPAPPGFPVAWESPEEQKRLWERELMHVPAQATVLDDAFMQGWIDGGFNAACEAFSMPVRNAYRRINTYEYQSIAPVSHDPVELEALGQEFERRVGPVLGRQLELWEDERLPEIKGYLADWEAFDLDGGADTAFLAHFDETVERSVRSWYVHFLTAFPVIFSMSLFDDLYRDLLGASTAGEPFELLQGFDNHTLEADRALYRLARSAAASPDVLAALEGPASELRARLAGAAGGTELLAALDGFLDRYGRRQDGYISVSEVPWLEDPSVVVAALRDQAVQPEHDPDGDLVALARARETRVAAARSRLADAPSESVGKFEFLLDAAQQGSVLQENHNFWIDGQVVFSVRRVVLAAGRRLAAASTLEDPGDVFHLTIEELRAGLAGDRSDLGPRIAERKAELERFAAIQAPPVLGTLPPGPPPDDPITRAVFKMFGRPIEQTGDPALVTGLAGSPGVVRGPARVISSLADAERLHPGDVLVTQTTSPPWTPFFQVAAAVVTDVGGSLSHCAIVAREYMIPAVVGTKVGTSVIRDGQLVEVDGTEGVVRIVEER